MMFDLNHNASSGNVSTILSFLKPNCIYRSVSLHEIGDIELGKKQLIIFFYFLGY